jgi:hypothetical protein
VFSLLMLFACSEYQLENADLPDEVPLPNPLAERVVTDVLHQRPLVEQADVLWVIDNSCSMEDDQNSLANAFPAFMNYFLGIDIDFHLGVVSTDMYAGDGQGKLREVAGQKWIDGSHPDPIPAFQMLATMGTGGSGDEMGRAPVYASIADHGEGHNAGFFRETAALSVIVISDEHDSSDMAGVGVDDFVGWLKDVKFDPSLVSYSTIVGPMPDGCATAQPGAGHVEVTEAIGGVNWSICDSQWERLLEELAVQSAGLQREFYLSEIPTEGTIEVRVLEGEVWTEFAVDTDWVYDAARNSVRFVEYVPPPLSQVEVTYVAAGVY